MVVFYAFTTRTPARNSYTTFVDSTKNDRQLMVT